MREEEKKRRREEEKRELYYFLERNRSVGSGDNDGDNQKESERNRFSHQQTKTQFYLRPTRLSLDRPSLPRITPR
jgi:hypothetical protein